MTCLARYIGVAAVLVTACSGKSGGSDNSGSGSSQPADTSVLEHIVDGLATRTS